MDRLLNIDRANGYPLCAETLELLHKNVQLLETVLNGLNLPTHTIVRFPYGDFAYVQSVAAHLGRGEILKIETGANLDNSEVYGYNIVTTDFAITDSTDNEYPDVYQERRLELSNVVNSYIQIRCYNFSELLEKALWKSVALRASDPYIDKFGTSIGSYVTGTPVVEVKSNDSELKIRIFLEVDSLPVGSDSEFRMVFRGGSFDNAGDVVTVWASFNGNSNLVNRPVSAAVVRHGSNSCFEVKMFTHELYESQSVTSFSGHISVNAVIFIHPGTALPTVITTLH